MKKQYKKVCVLCGRKFVGTSPNTKYCIDCRINAIDTIKKIRNRVYEKKSSEMLMKKYREGVIFVCSICGRKFRVHERTNRKICTECLSGSAYGRLLIRHRKEIKEEVVEE